MRRATSCGVLLLTVAPVLFSTPAAQASEDQRALAVDASAWSWRRVVPAGQPLGEPSNVPAGDLAVQFDGQPGAAPAKATYLRLALGDLPSGTVASAMTLVLPLDPSVSQDGSSAPLVACRLAAPFVTGEGVDPAKEPAEDCSGAPAGSYDAVGKTVSFTLTPLVQKWLSGAPNDGLVVRPDPAAAVPAVLPFQLTFLGAKAVLGHLTAVLPEPGAVTSPAPASNVEQPPPLYVAPQPGLASGPFVQGPVQSVPGPPVLVAPGVATTPSAVPQAAPVRHSRAARADSQGGFAAAIVLGLLLLVLVAWSVGEQAHPLAFARAERRRRDRIARGPVVVPVQPMQTRQGRRPASSATSTVTYS